MGSKLFPQLQGLKMSAHLCVIKHTKADQFKGNCKYIMHLCLKQTNSHDSLNLVLETDHVLYCKCQLSEVSDTGESARIPHLLTLLVQVTDKFCALFVLQTTPHQSLFLFMPIIHQVSRSDA